MPALLRARGILLFILLGLSGTFGAAPVIGAQTVLIPTGAVWKYLDNGSNQGTAWRALGFNDSAWAAGPAELGYGDSDEATVVGFGGNASAKFITTYFRYTFVVPDPSIFQSLTLRVLRDDGAVVYLNGTEVFRSNMPAGTVTSASLASAAIDDNTFYSAAVAPSLLVTGSNGLAVEIHQANGTSSDISFNLELTGSDAITVTRGPYLQLGTSTSTVVRWRTSSPTSSRVVYGPSPNNWLWSADLPASTTEHEVPLSSLTPNTTYYYAVGTSTATLAGGDSSYLFVTSPLPGTVKNTRVWVLGDSGHATANARSVRDAYAAFTGTRHTDLWLTLGDNAYVDGTDSEYQAAVFDQYPAMLRKSALWPTLGNHDGHSVNSATQTGPYYSMFTLPKGGEAGGTPTGTEAYYSFDYGNIHFVCLDAYDVSRSPSGSMLTWLQNDLANTSQTWVIAFWHHPPYSKGSHDSDIDVELREMRQNALPILEAAGVDLVLAGHSHAYERSFLIDGHYGLSGTFAASMKKDGGNGRTDGTGAYRKSTAGLAPHQGTVYAVAGTGSESGAVGLHPAMFTALNSLGSMVLDINGTRLDAKFLDQAGVTRDYFTLLKGVAPPPPAPPAAPSALTATAVSSTAITLAWTDRSSDESGFEIQRSVDNVTFATIGTVGPNVKTGSNTGLARNKTYYYRVRAFKDAGNRLYSGFSNVAQAKTRR